MQVTQHGEYLTKITKWRSMNCYLVREEDGLTLIDALMPGSEDGILQAAQQLGAPIVRILVTHAHVDHVGSVDALHKALPDVEVIFPARSARFLAGDQSLDPDEGEGELRGGIVEINTKPDRTIEAGDRVGSLEAIAAPGHTPGQMAFLDTRDRTLIAGDAWQTLGGVAISGQWSLFPLPKFATWHKPTAIKTAQALRALDPSRLAVGHGKVLESPTAAMDRALRKEQ
jgi:glyoxylase-like metal-dependent hydrolase (beta-lactamase superfamily II)